MSTSTCTRCQRETPSWEGVHTSDGEGQALGYVCGRCWARLLSEKSGEKVGHLEVAPMILEDARGRPHEFHFRYNPLPSNLESFELIDGDPGGYRFQVFEEDDEHLVEALLSKMRRSLAQEHVEPCEITRGGLSIKDRRVRGWIDWDEEQDGRLPRLIVDGRNLTWDQFGAMLMSFEGWNFDLRILDRSE